MCIKNCAKCGVLKTPQNTGINLSGRYKGKFRAYCKTCYKEHEAAKRRKAGIEERASRCSHCKTIKTEQNTKRFSKSGEFKSRCEKCEEAICKVRLEKVTKCSQCGVLKTLENTTIFRGRFVCWCKDCTKLNKKQRRQLDPTCKIRESAQAAKRQAIIAVDPVKLEKRSQRCRNYYENKRTSFDERVRRMLNSSKNRSEKRKLDFDLTAEFIVGLFETQQYKCLLTGIPFSLEAPKEGFAKNPFTPSLDRVDSRRGYTMDNVRLILTCINIALNEFGEDVLKQWVTAYKGIDNL
jgi:hypothetical protein